MLVIHFTKDVDLGSRTLGKFSFTLGKVWHSITITLMVRTREFSSEYVEEADRKGSNLPWAHHQTSMATPQMADSTTAAMTLTAPKSGRRSAISTHLQRYLNEHLHWNQSSVSTNVSQ